ncbi:MAG: M23 family metallopeptidase [Candidatus Thiodiazotropha sp.]
MKIVYLSCFLLILYLADATAAVYKYKNDSGKWVFTDKKPVEVSSEIIEFKQKKRISFKPRFYIKESDGKYNLIVENKFYAPIQLKIIIGEERLSITQLVAPKEIIILAALHSKNEKYRYRWVLGDPDSTILSNEYHVPVSKVGKYKVSQGFNGKFSHSTEPNKHAIDIALPIGTNLIAARAGTVISVKDDYHMGGKDKYFFDKANHVKILHEDGTYALYAHILIGSAEVKLGDKVVVGQKIARSGSSGYSTGPHLHFVIKKNVGMKTISLPFYLVDAKGRKIHPRKGVILNVPRKT